MGLYLDTAPLVIKDLPAHATHYTRGRKSPMGFIVLHHTGGVDSRDWLTHTSSPPVSCNRLITKDGTVYKIVRDEDTAWAQGFSTVGPYQKNGPYTMNDVGLSIELENLGNGKDSYPESQIMSTVLQCAEWWGMYGLLPIVGHGQIDSRKVDPRGFPWSRFYRSMLGHIRTLGNK